MNIEWKEINPDYIISSDGRIASRVRGGLYFMKPDKLKDGYLRASLRTARGQSRVLVHRLVAEAFLGPPPTPEHECNHKNGIRDDNRDHNLEWVTPSQNVRHSFEVLGKNVLCGEANGHSKMTEAGVRDIRARRNAGERLRVISADYGITESSVCAIAKGRVWAWLV